MRRVVHSVCVIGLVVATLGVGGIVAPTAAGAHSGGLDSNGGHYCRSAGYNSGKCGPLNSYHTHSGGGSPAPPPATPAPTPPAAQPIAAGPCTPDPTGSVTRLYLAYFLRAPDAGGLAFWVDRCNRRVSSLIDISDAFAGSPEFGLRYGALDNAAFVTLVYRNVLARDPDAGGLQASIDFLGRGARRGEVMLGFSESPEFIAKSGVG